MIPFFPDVDTFQKMCPGLKKGSMYNTVAYSNNRVGGGGGADYVIKACPHQNFRHSGALTTTAAFVDA